MAAARGRLVVVRRSICWTFLKNGGQIFRGCNGSGYYEYATIPPSLYSIPLNFTSNDVVYNHIGISLVPVPTYHRLARWASYDSKPRGCLAEKLNVRMKTPEPRGLRTSESRLIEVASHVMRILETVCMDTLLWTKESVLGIRETNFERDTDLVWDQKIKEAVRPKYICFKTTSRFRVATWHNAVHRRSTNGILIDFLWRFRIGWYNETYLAWQNSPNWLTFPKLVWRSWRDWGLGEAWIKFTVDGSQRLRVVTVTLVCRLWANLLFDWIHSNLIQCHDVRVANY
jgi:hypothetical protein